MKLQKTCLLRVDASEKLGLGHLMRCIALAQGLKKESIRSIFVLKDYKEAYLISEYGFDFELISQQLNFAEDALKTMQIAAQYHTRMVIVDLSHSFNLSDHANFRKYFRMLKEQEAVIMTFDDYDKVEFPMDIHVIPYYGAEEKNYRFSSATKPLLGLDYFIFREEFIAYRTHPRIVRTTARNVLIAMGGSDPANVTAKIIDSLAETQIPINVKIVLGNGFTAPKRDVVISQIKKYRAGQYEIIENAKNMAELMLWADVVLTGGGLIKYEAALTGTPNIIISQEQREAQRCEEYAQADAAIHLGHFKDLKKDIRLAVLDLLNDVQGRQMMSKKGQHLVDGEGRERLIKHILEMETALV